MICPTKPAKMNDMAYQQVVVMVFFCAFTFGFGAIALGWPEAMQKYAVKHCTKFYFWPNPFLGWLKTPSYLVYLRVMGVFSIALGFVVLTAFFGNK
jgi:hypothetical protein